MPVRVAPVPRPSDRLLPSHWVPKGLEIRSQSPKLGPQRACLCSVRPFAFCTTEVRRKDQFKISDERTAQNF